MSEATIWGREDRDLLIELRTEMKAIRADMQDIKGNFTGRILNLESNAINRVQFDDHERRIRFIERYMWLAIGGLMVVEFALNYFK